MLGETPIPRLAGWPVVTLRDITLKIGSGATPQGGAEAYLPVRERFALVRSQNVFDRHFDTDGLAFISDEQAERLKGVMLQPHDILLNITGDGVTFGRTCIAPTSVLPACVNQHVSIIRVNPHVADPGFVLSFLTHPDVKPYIESFNAGGSRRAITKGHIESFRLPLPPLSEQRAIAHTLGTLDDRIELNRRMNKTLEAMAQALFKSWFIDFDPVHAKAEGRQPSGMDLETAGLFPSHWVASTSGLIPEGWRWATVGELVKQRGGETRTGPFGTALQASEYCAPGVAGTPVIAVRDIGTGYLELDHKTPRVNQEVVDRLSAFKVQPRDILFGRKGAVERFAVVGPRQSGWLMGSDCIRLRLDPNYSEYLRFQFLQEPHREWMMQNATGTTMPSLNQSIIERIPVLLPNEPLVSAFARLVAPLDQMIRSNHEQNASLSEIRNALLPGLLSGKIALR